MYLIDEPSARVAQSPLAGMRIVITRAEDRADTLIKRLRDLGAEPLVYPTIAFAPPADCGPLDAALQRLAQGGYDWLALTSVTAVQFVQEHLAQQASPRQGQPPSLHPDLRIAAVGPTTAAACQELLGAVPALVPEKFVAEALAEALGDLQGQRVLLANADIARPTLEERLRAAGALVDRVVAYRTVPASGGPDVPGMLLADSIAAITFTSGSTLRYFAQRVGPEAFEHARRSIIVCIGPATAAVATEMGMPPTVVASVSTEEGMVAALVEYVLRGA